MQCKCLDSIFYSFNSLKSDVVGLIHLLICSISKHTFFKIFAENSIMSANCKHEDLSKVMLRTLMWIAKINWLSYKKTISWVQILHKYLRNVKSLKYEDLDKQTGNIFFNKCFTQTFIFFLHQKRWEVRVKGIRGLEKLKCRRQESFKV